MYYQAGRGRARGRGRRGNIRGNEAGGRSGFGSRPPPPPYHCPLPQQPHADNVHCVLQLAEVWGQYGKGSASLLKQMLWEAFNSCSKPYWRLLDLVVFSPDYCKHRPDGATATVLDVFRSYLKKTFGCVDNVPEKLLNDKVKMAAFRAVCHQECSAIGDAIVEVCGLTRGEPFVEEIHRMVAAWEYKKACQMATRLRLQPRFEPKLFLLPLVLQDRVNLVESFLSEASAEKQRATIAAIDAIIDRSLNAVASELGMPGYSRHTVNAKTLKRLVERLCRKYQLPVREAAPGAALAAARGQLNFVLYRRFREASVRPDDCEDFLMEILAYYPELIPEVLERLCRESALRTAFNLAEALAVPARELPYMLEDIFLQQVPCPEFDRDQQSRTAVKPADQPLFFRLPASVDILMVDSCQQLPLVTSQLESYRGPLGLDAEWRPVSVREWIGCSLLQVATESLVYVLDLLKLKTNTPEMRRLGLAILCGDNLKLGYDLSSDFDTLQQSVPAFDDAIHGKKNMLDIKLLSSRVEAAFPDVFPFREESTSAVPRGSTGNQKKPKEAHKGLSELVRRCIGRPLDKEEQCSNWERRPLRSTQLQYAALDAHCLIAVHAVLSERLQQLHATTPRQVLQCVVTAADGSATAGDGTGPKQAASHRPPPTSKHSTPQNKPKELENAPAPNQRAIRPDQFRVVCDTMVQGLGKKLRSIGADAVILENGEEHDACVTLCQEEQRIILTRGRALHQRMSGMVAAGYCYRVMAEKAVHQLDEVVQHFRLDIAPDDVFKRCQHCNSGDYWRVPTAVMRRLQRRDNCGWVPLEGSGDTHVLCATGQIRDCEVVVWSAAVRETTLESVDTFYVCQGCGQVYWAGSHQGRYLASLGHILHSQQGQTAAAAEGVTDGLRRLRVPGDSDSEDGSDDCPP